MEKKEIFFRVDGDAQIGLGHLVRCIALAQMLKDDFKISFVCKAIPETLIFEIKQLGFELIKIQAEDVFLLLLNNKNIAVLDHYGLGTDCQKKIKDKGCKLVCVDDLHDKKFFADLIINHAPGIFPSNYQAQTYTQYALGLDYVLLRPSFLKNIKKAVITKNIKTVFVCFGGSDSKNITQRVVNIIKDDVRFEKISIVTGTAYMHLDKLKETVGNNDKFELYHAIDPDMMVGLIADADLAIVPSSGILQEVLAIGNKVISGIYIENQKYLYENYKSLHAFESAGDFSEKNIRNAIDRCYAGLPFMNTRVIDGRSGNRLLKYFKQLSIEDDVTLQNAKEDDLMKTFEWASNADIRKYSFNSKPVEFIDHEKWFMNKLNTNTCFYYIGLLNNIPFGSLRFDIEGQKAIISYLIDPLYQKKGLGSILLKKGLEQFINQFNTKQLCVYGEVLPDNVASIKVFQKLGYAAKTNSSNNVIIFEKLINA